MSAKFSSQSPPTHPDETESEGPSKSELKRQSTELQVLGEKLLTLRSPAREALTLPQRLTDALSQLARIKQFSGRRRQSQYVGKLMRQLDEHQIEAIRQAIEGQEKGSAADAQRLHRIENWRVRLLLNDDAIGDWLAEYPDTDVQQLRALLRQARKARDAIAPDTPPSEDAGSSPRKSKHHRQLFQWLRDAIHQAQTTSDTPPEPPPLS